MQIVLLVFVGVATGGMVALQNVINASLGRHVGTLGAVFVVAFSSMLLILALILLFPSGATLRGLPGLDHWYLYLGGVLGICIVAAPVYLVPRIGATATVTAIVAGQLLMALAADQFALFGNPRIAVTLPRVIGLVLLAVGAYLIVRN